MTPIRFGIIGSGDMAELHSLALRNDGASLYPELPSIEMVRMADLSAPAAREGAARWGWQDSITDTAAVTQADDRRHRDHA